MKATPLLLVIAACSLGAGGCSNWYATNSDEAVARAWAPADFCAPVPDSTDHTRMNPGPATTSLDRSDWPLTTIVAHNAQPQHQPIFTRNVRYDGGIPRNAGRYPTIGTSVDSITSESTDAQVGEALMAPLAAMGDVVLFPIRIFRTGMWKPVDNGLEPYERELGSSWQRAARADLLAKPAGDRGPQK